MTCSVSGRGIRTAGVTSKFEAPEFLLAGEVLRGLARGAARDQSEIRPDRIDIEHGFGIRVEPGAVAAERVHQQQFRGERVRGDFGCAQAGHCFFQCGANVTRQLHLSK